MFAFKLKGFVLNCSKHKDTHSNKNPEWKELRAGRVAERERLLEEVEEQILVEEDEEGVSDDDEEEGVHDEEEGGEDQEELLDGHSTLEWIRIATELQILFSSEKVSSVFLSCVSLIITQMFIVQPLKCFICRQKGSLIHHHR